MSTASFNEIAIGAVLGETYEVSRLLGEGGMGAVWEARHLRLPGKRFAIKVLHTSASADREAYARFRREAEIASRIGHPNIIEVLDWNTLPSGTPYLVLEFLDGEDLAQRLAAGALPIEQALSITRQIGAALKAAHAAEVVHRDLKPGNVFLVPRESGGEILDHVKVLDFGISKIRNSQTVQTQDAVLLGTPQYMAPEQALGKNNEIDGRTDVFALGAIVYEMLAGRAAFQGSTLAEVVFKVVYEPVPPLAALAPHVDPTIIAAIEKAMAKAPNDRFADVSSFIGALTGRGLATGDRRAVRASVAGMVPPTYGRTATSGTSDTARSEPPASQLRGELQARPGGGGGSKTLLLLLVAIVIGGGGTFAAVKLLGGKTNAGDPKTIAAATKTVDPKPVDTKPVDTKPVDPKPVDTKPTAVAGTESVGKKKTGDKPHVEPAAAAEPPEVKALLDEAEAALRSNHGAQALLLADRAMRVQKSSRAYSIQTRAHCKNGDLGNARATFQHLSSGEKARARKDCKASDIDLN